jgi:hypothetical protein
MHPLNDVTQLFIEFGKWRLKKLQLPCMTWQEADNDDKTVSVVLPSDHQTINVHVNIWNEPATKPIRAGCGEQF